MARDSQAALVALNRFGFGARGGASGDFLNAASDPRGFVKAELGRPNGVLLEVPGLQSTPALGKAVFDYQFEIQQARDAAAKRPRRRPRPKAATAAGCEGAAAEPFAQQHRHGYHGQRAIGGSRRSRRKIAMRRWRPPRRCSPTRQSRRRNRSTSSRRPFAPRRWRGCSAASSPIAASSSGWWCSGPIISASPPTRAGWRGCGPARSSARRSGRMCSGVSATC